MTTGSAQPGRIITQLSTDPRPTLDTDEAGTPLKYTDTGAEFEWSGSAWYQTKGPDSSGALAVKTTAEITKDLSAKPAAYSDGNTTGSIAAAGTAVLGDLTPYGYPYKTLTFTNAGANAATIVWAAAQGFIMIDISGTTPSITLTATNTNGDTISDVLVISPSSANPVTGATLGAGIHILYRP